MKQDDMVSAAYAQGRRDQRQSDEALLRKALEAMEYSGMDVGKFNRINAACAALRAALAEPVQEPAAKYSDIVSDGGMDPRNKYDTAPLHHDKWTDADSDAARLAMELEALLLSCKDTAAVSRWWDSAHDALELHRQRLSMDRLANQQKTSGSPCPTCEALARAVMMDQTGKA